ncbi:MAG: apolipoprotein N-acyltransferase [Vicinamibacterales bacterium]|nr:apolipoprotein N-acyltransferase [Vicinamibacterales bacterium]
MVAQVFDVGPTGRRSGAFLAAALSGGLLALSFPSLGHPAAAWVALTPLLVVLHGTRSLSRAFGLGLTTGAIHFAGMLPWLTQVMVEFGGVALPIGVLLNGLLVAYLALFPAAFAVIVALLCARLGGWALLGAAPVWLTTELGRLWLFGGFPWELLGYSQTGVLPVAQLASLFGVHGVTLLVVFVNSALALALVGPPRHRWRVLATAGGALGVVVLFGAWRLSDDHLVRDGVPLRVGVVQGNVLQTDKWDPAMRPTILTRYLDLSRQSAGDGAQLIVWPESATPFSFEDHPDGEAVRQLARDTGAHVLFGSTQSRRDPVPRAFVAAFALRPDGETAAVYHKRHLVPFGEYVPFRSLLFFVSPLVETVANFTPGTGPLTLPIGTHLASTAICYEIIYPALVRSFVRQGSQLLTTITNDAWYGRSAAPHQHFQQATMRAIEQGRYLVRAANTGISGLVDPYGRVLARSALFETAVITEDVRLLSGLTVYGRIGDLVAYLCAVLTVAAVFAVRHTRVKASATVTGG